jgi:septal ring factor EnvC (AmiA/AmiB activator)
MGEAQLEQQLAQVESEIAECVSALRQNWARRNRMESSCGQYEARYDQWRTRLIELQERRAELLREFSREVSIYESARN